LARLKWDKLLSAERFSDSLRPKLADRPEPLGWLITDRTEIERDFDRILFSTPMRRLGDKTQVFPRERNESVRNRLTHTHEVTNLARTVGHYIVHGTLGDQIFQELGDSGDRRRVIRDVPAMLTAIALAHDLGNPPFGHQGEHAIRTWMERNSSTLFSGVKGAGGEHGQKIEAPLLDAQQKDFLLFEGNAQTFRVLTRLQVVDDDLGLNLTYGTLAALMKYTAGADAMNPDGANAALKKVGYFQSEQQIAQQAREQCGLIGSVRHPLTFIMEACDDVAYTVLDAEDAVKKQIVSFSDVLAWMRQNYNKDELTKYVVDQSEYDHHRNRETRGLSPSELNDVSMQKFRVHSIHAMMSAVIRAFELHYEEIMEGRFQANLVGDSKAAVFAKALKEFDARHAYRNRRVRGLELEGFNVLHGLMDQLWWAITQRPDYKELSPKNRSNPFASYVYDLISENYRRIFENNTINSHRKNQPTLPIRYRELQLLTDMVSGMTDEYAIDLYGELSKFAQGASAIIGGNPCKQ
jgi:dGTPase